MIIELGYPIHEMQTTPFKQVVQRLKDEHDALKKELDLVQDKTNHLRGSDEWTDLLREIRKQMAAFMTQLEEHEHWEEEEVLPLLARYANQGMEPSFITSTWVMEEDHKQAERFVRSFNEIADQCMATNGKELKRVISLLRVACSVLNEHLLAEEEMFFPVADQMLNER
ncbi:hemerythrin domain-containing protein [Paenibacillus sp. GCM10023248]|uniref:hemerythrin domain-containing protein n=1 Tax=unclassified Paenibacillus TaxID=185978 RepID=UPI002379B913|nr:hemerythrin domain-containing protein [Paenibacillus sp. MAHUQ-63]MDD9266767.1 hemerythrin domain-containing protein [Paenibacillus sp. MAHUQ-63]